MAVKKATSATKAASANKTVPPAKGATKAAAARKTVPPAKGATKAVPARATGPAAKGTTKAVQAKPSPTRKATKSAPASRRQARTTAKASAAAAPVRTRKPAAGTSTGRQRPLRVREDEAPWTADELEAVRADLEADVARLKYEISVAESELAGLMRDAGDGAGDDQADAGTKTFEREQEISLANNARVMFEQSEHALERIADRSYGICESCGSAIGKNRLLAFPRATLCMPCKSKQERR